MTSLQKTTLIPGGSESLVYITLSGGIGMLVPFTSHEVMLLLYTGLQILFKTMHWAYRILPKKHAPPQIDAPPKFMDHVPEVSSSKIYMTVLFNDRFNAVTLSQLFTVTGPKSQVAILFQ